jgi:hypothetical protein
MTRRWVFREESMMMRSMSRVDMACEGNFIDIGNKHSKCIQDQIADPKLQE